MDIEYIRHAIRAANATHVSKEAVVPLRTVFRFRSGAYPEQRTLLALDAWVREHAPKVVPRIRIKK